MPPRKAKHPVVSKGAKETPAGPTHPPATPAEVALGPLQSSTGFAVLASHVRYDILQSLSARAKTIRELTQELRMHRLTIRYHINFLLREGLIEELHSPRAGTSGRPPVLYRTSRHARVPGYPPRRFEIIAQAALSTLLEALGQGDAQARLAKKGKEFGSMTVKALAAANGLKRWTPDTFDQHMLKGMYRQMGVTTEVLSKSKDEIQYRAFGCPFLELAEQMPEVVCNALDKGFHDGISQELGDAKTVRLRCMGHGDPFCEYAVTWPKRRKLKAGSTARPSPALPKQEALA